MLVLETYGMVWRVVNLGTDKNQSARDNDRIIFEIHAEISETTFRDSATELLPKSDIFYYKPIDCRPESKGFSAFSCEQELPSILVY